MDFTDEKWMEDSKCSDEDLKLFFPDKDKEMGINTRKAKNICESCSVKEECRDYAILHKIEYGIWGAMTPNQRKNFKKENPNKYSETKSKPVIVGKMPVHIKTKLPFAANLNLPTSSKAKILK